MKFLFLVVFLGCCTVLFAQNSKPVKSSGYGGANELSQLAERWQAAYNAKDTAAIAALYTRDAVYCSAHVPGLVASGRNQIRDYFRGGMMMGGHIDTIIVLSSDVTPELATFFCKYVATNSGVTVNGRNLIVAKKADGKWLFDKHMTVVKD